MCSEGGKFLFDRGSRFPVASDAAEEYAVFCPEKVTLLRIR